MRKLSNVSEWIGMISLPRNLIFDHRGCLKGSNKAIPNRETVTLNRKKNRKFKLKRKKKIKE